MQYVLHIGNSTHKSVSVAEALDQMSAFIRLDREDVASQLTESGVALVMAGDRMAQLTDTLWTDPAPEDPQELARKKVIELYGQDGELEVDEGAPVSEGVHGYNVMVWVWVSDSDAGIDESDDDTEAMARRYIQAAEHPVAEFDLDAGVSMGSDDGAYVSGWICVGIEAPESTE